MIQKLSEHCDLFAVFDGHSGSGAVRLTVELLPRRIQAALEAAGPDILRNTGRLAEILKTVFIEHDKELARNRVRDSGTTASVALVTDTHIVLAYLGDSPVFLMDPRSGMIQREGGKHEPTLAGETERIRRAGGTVEIDEYGTPRVDGSLMVSRAFGDFSLKFDGAPPFDADWTQMKVTAHPDVMIWERPEYSVLAIMSDGLVETLAGPLKPLQQVAADIKFALEKNALDLPRSAELTVRRHVAEATRGARPESYDGDDLSIILVDVGKQTASLRQVQAGGDSLAILSSLSTRARTRKGRMGRRNKTGKRNRVVKILGF